MLVAVLQTGVVPVHAPPLVAEHCAHAPVPRQAGVEDEGHACGAPAPLSPSHASHRLALRSQTGAVRGQLAFEVHPQVLFAVLQTGLAPKHAVELLDEHCAQNPPTHAGRADVEHAAVAAVPLSPLHGTQTPFAVLQTGADAGQFVLSLQPQTLPDATQTGVVPAHAVALVDEHCTHCPPRHAGAAGLGQASDAPEPLSPLQGMHVLVPRSQIGADEGHCKLAVQPQSPVVRLHTGLLPVQSEPFVAEHCAQAPDPRHAGDAGDVQERGAPEPLSPLQAAHAPVVVSQVGVVPEHWPLLLAEHWPHAPEPWHAGVPGDGQERGAPDPLSPLQPAQLPVAVSQRGDVPEHWLLLLAEHCAHAPLS